VRRSKELRLARCLAQTFLVVFSAYSQFMPDRLLLNHLCVQALGLALGCGLA
jgi:hypothetical protein